jgi:hypothetical protein
MCELFPRPADAERRCRRDDLAGRALLVCAIGWERFLLVWSTGEVGGVAALLGHDNVLQEIDETLQSVLSRWAFDLWGFIDGQADVDRNHTLTRAWLAEIASTL